jgi:sulfite reductase (NADPH) hemoprotein beta-component
MGESVITASRLQDGVVVWLADQGWDEAFNAARRVASGEVGAALTAAEQYVRQNLVTDLHTAELDDEGVPVEPRERIRAAGPTVRLDLQHLPRPAPGRVLPPLPSASSASPFAGIYRYDEFDRQFLRDRATRFGEQTARRCRGELSEDEFKPLRLMNGLYLQLHGYMLRVAIPYGVLSSTQMRQFAYVARHYDRGYGHFTTRQNIQFNWPRLDQAAEILGVLAEADLHAIQTSGNCVRNVTTDQFAGAAADEIVDPRVTAEILRQWSTDHPEFTYLPRKFKIAITGSKHDRAAIKLHDIGIMADRNDAGEIGFAIYAGGGLGRTPLIATKLRDFLPMRDLLRYVEAILRVYNALGRRDNIYKARIKILLRDMKPGNFLKLVEDEFASLADNHCVLTQEIVDQVSARFVPPAFDVLPDSGKTLDGIKAATPEIAPWLAANTHPHRIPGYISAVVSLKPPGGIPGDASAEEMEFLADLADRYSFGELRVTHEQNLVLPHLRATDILAVWQALRARNLATANIAKITDIICCPGMDYCALATARSIPVAQRLAENFADAEKTAAIGDLTINMSGCINACGHHHVGNIGLLGVDRNGEEVYQITLGGSADEKAAIGTIIGPAVPTKDVVGAVDKIVAAYLAHRNEGERFIDTYRRLGNAPFKEAVYASH